VAISSAEGNLNDLKDEYEALWALRSEAIRLRLQAEATRGLKATIGNLNAQRAGLEAARHSLISLVGQSQKDQEKHREEAAHVASLDQQIHELNSVHAKVLADQVKLEMAGSAFIRSGQYSDLAEVPRVPVRNLTPALLLLSPLVAFFLVLLLYL